MVQLVHIVSVDDRVASGGAMAEVKQESVSRAVLVTGCSSGIGKATVLRLAKNGWQVYATARKIADLDEARAAGCTPLALDVTSEESMAAAVRAIESMHGAVGVLVNNAGYSQSGAIEAVPLDRVRAQFETNVFGVARLTQLVLPGMRRQRWGRIVNMSSMGGRLTFPGFGYYHATKYAVEALSDALRFEVRNFGIGVSLVEPGLVKSGFAEAASSGMKINHDVAGTYEAFHALIDQSTKASYEKGPLALLSGVPDDVARVVERAISSRRPRPRYTVTWSAKVLLAQKKLLTDGGWDWFLRRMIPSPGGRRDDVARLTSTTNHNSP
jgi:NAD(P)-dependent dehydrogenase (short-subunit alcohol dehydrogenase family)